MNDEFRISRYLRHYSEQSDDCNCNAIGCECIELDKVREWERESGLCMIHPVDTLEELEEIWMNYNQMTTANRKIANNKSMEIYGINNIEHYNKLKHQFNDADIDNKEIAPYIETSDLSHDFDSVNYSPYDGEIAREWSRDSGYPIIYPTRTLDELEELWNNFLQYPFRIRNLSDTESIRIFGMTNGRHYNYLKSCYMKEDLPDLVIQHESAVVGDLLRMHETFGLNDNADTSSRAADLMSLAIRKNENYENAVIRDIVDKVTGEYKASNQNVKYDPIPYEDLPFFTPEEMIDAGVNQADPEKDFYGCEPITNVISDVVSEDANDWFTDYANICAGITVDYDPIKWKDNVAKLFLKMRTAEDKNPYKQAILNFGWPPEAEFSPENRVVAKNRIKAFASEQNGSTQFVDLTGMDAEDISEAAVAVKNDNVLLPVYIVLEEGKSAFSAAIKKVTDSVYSHAAISFDPEMKTMYSYGIEGSEKGFLGGFIKEDIRDKDPDKHMAVFAIFLKPDDWSRLRNIISQFIENAGKTGYSYLNIILSNIFRIPLNRSKKMICSQFVDRVLKLINVDISNKNSAFVVPADFQKFAKENKKIYILFDDLVSKFKGSRIKGLTTRLSKKADPIKESIRWTDPVGIVYEMINHIHSLESLQEIAGKIDIDKIDKSVRKIYESMIAPCLEAECYFGEAKNFPIQVDKWGNLFINNIRKRNFASEYANCHTLLREYDKADNIEGIKYELFKLWAIELAIQDRLSTTKFKKMDSSELNKTEELKTHAKVMGDFQYFLAKVMEKDPKFNFTKEFNKSPFNSDNIRITANTIKWSGKTLKAIMKAI